MIVTEYEDFRVKSLEMEWWCKVQECKQRENFGPDCVGCMSEKECELAERSEWDEFKETEDYKFELSHGKQFPEDF